MVEIWYHHANAGSGSEQRAVGQERWSSDQRSWEWSAHWRRSSAIAQTVHPLRFYFVQESELTKVADGGIVVGLCCLGVGGVVT